MTSALLESKTAEMDSLRRFDEEMSMGLQQMLPQAAS